MELARISGSRKKNEQAFPHWEDAYFNLVPRGQASHEAGRLAQDRNEHKVRLLGTYAGMKIYLAGKIRGVPDHFERFARSADQLRMQGHLVYNPAAANLEGLPLNRIMAHVLPQLCECEAIALLPNWWRSGGARIEWMLARYLGLKRIYL